MTPAELVPGRPTWQQAMLRIKDPAKSLHFYRDLMGMTLVDKLDFPQYSFALYFLSTLPAGETLDVTPGTQEAHDKLWSMEGVALELTHNYGTEEKDDFRYYPGNQERDGFGHMAFNCNPNTATEKLLKAGVSFKKKPEEGRMKGIAFARDPDGYLVELCNPPQKNMEFNLSQCMLRVKDPKKSVSFYRSMGMSLLQERHFDDFSLYFLATGVPEPRDPSTASLPDDLFNPVLELTHNHGTEDDEDFKYFNGNEDGKQGFGHVGFLVDDVYVACDAIREFGYGFRKEPDGGSMKGLAFAYDPDGYSVEIVKRGGMDFGDVKVTK